MKLKAYFKQLAIDLKPMTFTEKIEHIWTYNKELILITAGVLFLVIGLLVTFIQRPDVMFCGFIVNGELDDRGTSYLTTDYLEVLGGTGRQEVQLMSGVYSTTLASAAEASEATKLRILALCSDQSLDYIIADKDAMEAILGDGICMDLATFFTEEEYAQWQDKMLVGTGEDGSAISYAVKISDTKFAKDNVVSNKELYLCFIENTKNVDRCHEFWAYLLNWQ